MAELTNALLMLQTEMQAIRNEKAQVDQKMMRLQTSRIKYPLPD
jgi:hypothetical protein